MEKRGQVTIFIIMGILLVSVILLYFLYVKPTFIDGRTGNLNFEGCVEEAIEKSIQELENGGFIDAQFTYPYNGEDIAYLCYNGEYYKTCTVQVPFLKQHYTENLKKLTSEDVQACYDDAISDLREQGYTVSSGNLKYNISLDPGIVDVLISAPTTIESSSMTKLRVKMNSPIYEMLMISTSILQFETEYGNTDTNVFMATYPDYSFDKIKRGDGTTIYIIESKIYKTKFKFAVRSLVWPAGYANE